MTQRSHGFTLVELLIVFAIIAVITVVAILNQNNFNKSIILANTAYDTALTFRAAEVAGLGNRVVGNSLKVNYGLHFDKEVSNSYILFADTTGGETCTGSNLNCNPGDGVYQSSGPPTDVDSLIQTYAFGNEVTIAEFCMVSGTSFPMCLNSYILINTLDIVFPRASGIVTYAANGSVSYADFACVTLKSPQGVMRSVKIQRNGQIAATASGCPW